MAPAWRVGLVLGTATIVGAALVFGLAVRLALRQASARTSAWTALALGVVTVLSVAVLWLALPPIFGVAALTLAATPATAPVPRRSRRNNRCRPGHPRHGRRLCDRSPQLAIITAWDPPKGGSHVIAKPLLYPRPSNSPALRADRT
jgi:hypothetical protein